MKPPEASDPDPWPRDEPIAQNLPDLLADLACVEPGRPLGPPASPAWEWLVRTCDPLIRQAAHASGIASAEVPDCVQEVWIKVVQALRHRKYDPRRGRFGGWLSTLVRHAAADPIKHQKRHATEPLDEDTAAALPSHEPDPAADDPRQRRLELVRGAIGQLRDQATPRSYAVFRLRYDQGWTFGEIATALGLTPDQARSRSQTMIDQLRRLLKRHGADRMSSD